MANEIASDGGATSAVRVGEVLSAERKRLGFTVQEAAESLKLRVAYLEAIEQSRLEDLPGTTYAAGFVRAYAEYLGLDGPDIIRRFKGETATLTHRTTLSFPAPVSEGRVPSRSILTASAIVGIFIYAVWHFFASGERSVVEAVPEVPAQLGQAAPESPLQEETSESAAAAINGAGDPSTPVQSDSSEPPANPVNAPLAEAQPTGGLLPGQVPAQAKTQGPVATQPPDQALAPGLIPAPTLGLPGAIGPAATQGPVPSTLLEALAPTLTPTPIAPQRPAKAPAQPPVQAPAQTQAPTTAPAQAQSQARASASTTAAVPPAEQAGMPKPPVRPPTKVEPGTEGGTVPVAPNQNAQAPASQGAPVVLKRPAGIDAGDSRIVLRANADSWIEIQDDGGSVLLRQILRAGESYRVPNRAGLSLMTGNAGGIEVSVDGKPGRRMGPSGIARRNIPLDPEQLLSGATND